MFSYFYPLFYPCSVSLRTLLTKIVIVLLFSFSISQERIGDWNCYTSTLNIRDISIINQSVYCATDGGILRFDLLTHLFTPYTKLNGLTTTNLSVIETGKDELLWIGGNSPGIIQRFDPSKEMVIMEFPYEFSEISHIVSGDSIAYAVYRENQDWGLAEYRFDNFTYEHKDLYPDWILADNGINDIEIIGNSVFVGTEIGLFQGYTGENPNLWTLVSQEVQRNITDLEVLDESLLIIMDSEIYLMNLESYDLVNLEKDDLSLIESTSSGFLWGVNSSKNKLIEVETNDWIELPSKANCLVAANDSLIIVGLERGILMKNLYDSSYNIFVPNTLPTNQISALTILNDGRLVAGSYKGLSILENGVWRNIIETTSDEILIHESFSEEYFSADTIPVDFGGYIADIEQGPDGKVYCAIRGTYPEPRRHGGGIVIVDVDYPQDFTLIDTTYLDYFKDEYLVVKDLKFDYHGNLWVADAYATTHFTPIHKMTPTGEWTSYSYDDSDYTFSLTPNSIETDQWGRIWIGFFTGEENTVDGVVYPNGGLMMMEENENSTGVSVQSISLSSIYSNKSFWSLGIVRDRLFSISPNGLTYFDLQKNDNNPIRRQGPTGINGSQFSYFPQVSFGGPDPSSKLKVDPQNNIWVGSPSQGVYVLLNDSRYWPDAGGIREFDTPLLSDQITDIVFDSNNGVSYIATNRGINSLKIPFSANRNDYSQLKVFPSPFFIPSETPLVIAGAIQSSSLLVTTISGKVIYSKRHSEMGVHGDQITWDGRDNSGKWAGSGVYLLSVYSEDGSHTVEKITVVRK